MITYDSFLDANVSISSECLKKKMEELSLAYSEELTKAYISKAMRLYVMVKHLQNTLDFLDVQNVTSPIRTGSASLGYRIQEMEGEIEYIAIACMGLTDICALFINHAFSLGVETTKAYFSSISESFKDATHHEELLKKIRNQISSIRSMDEYKYISSMNNYAKHNNVICASLEHSDKPITFHSKIKSFTHKGRKYPDTAVYDFIDKIKSIQNSLADIYFTILHS